MKRTPLSGLVVITALGAWLGLASCGDNSDECGPGTTAIEGVCTVAAGSNACGSGTTPDMTGVCVPVCGDGTILSPTGVCVIDPVSCQDGTVLVGSDCVDAGRISGAIEEGPEPNGLGILGEDSNGASAGTFAINAIGGSAVVLHGHITPHAGSNGGPTTPDVDSFVVDVAGPTALQVSVDGVGGLQGGFIALFGDAIAPTDPLAGYQRFGVNLTGDTANRQILLPTAGHYVLAITDSRTLFYPGEEAYGDATTEYYASITQIALPAATTIAVSATGTPVTVTTGQLAVVSYPANNGINDIAMSVTESSITPGFELLVDSATYRTTANGANPEVTVLGFTPGQAATIVIDPELDLARDPAVFQIAVRTGTSTALSTTGGTASEPIPSTTTPLQPSDLLGDNVFSYVVPSDATPMGLELAFSEGVEGILVDQNFNFVSFFADSPFPDGGTFTTFDGYVLHATAGTYYFLIDVPNGTPGATLTVTSTIAAAVPTVTTIGTATGAIPTGGFDSALFTTTVDATDHPWIAFAATLSGGGAGPITATAYDPADGNFGRLSALTTSAEVVAPDALATFARTLTGTPSAGRVVIDDRAATYLLAVAPATVAAGSKLDFTITDRTFSALLPALAAPGTSASLSGQLTTDGTTFYLVRGANGNVATVTSTPTGSPEPRISEANLDADENVTVTFADGSGSSAPVGGAFDTHANGWLAIAVAPLAGGIGETYEIAANAVASTNYGITPSNTAFGSGACGLTGGITIPLNDDGTGTGDGLSDPIAPPPGFKLYGADVGSYIVSSSGWLAFTSAPNAVPINLPIPSAALPNQMIAPYWTNMSFTSVCVATSPTGTTQTIEWVGVQNDSFASVVAQVELDGSGTITFSYDPVNMEDFGGDATIGVEDLAATSKSQQVLFDSPTLDVTKSIVFTPQ